MPPPPPLLPLASTQMRPPVQARLQLPWELKEPPHHHPRSPGGAERCGGGLPVGVGVIGLLEYVRHCSWAHPRWIPACPRGLRPA